MHVNSVACWCTASMCSRGKIIQTVKQPLNHVFGGQRHFQAMSRSASVKCGSTLGSDNIGRHDIGPFCR